MAGPRDPYRRGLLVHRLLQMLPAYQAEEWELHTRRFLAGPAHGLSEDEQAQLAAETLAVLRDPQLGPLFGPESRAEVPVVGCLPDGQVLSGRIDRLVVTPGRVLILDYKSNRPPPLDPKDVPEAYLSQLAAYAAAIREIYPDRAVEAAILWTDGPRLMPVGGDLLQRFG